jgi:ankyrin repeat protein
MAVKILLSERQDNDINCKDKFGSTPLSIAAQSGFYRVVKELLAHEKIDVNTCDTFGCTPLFKAT